MTEGKSWKGWRLYPLIVALLFIGCKNGTGPGPEDLPEHTKEITAIDNEARAALGKITFSIDGETVGEDTLQVSVSREEGTTITIKAKRDGYKDRGKSITFSDSSSVQVPLQMDEAEMPQTACNDGTDNDSDALADANDPGCIDTWASTSHEPGTDGFVYEPEDDSETLIGWRQAATSPSGNTTYLISGADGERDLTRVPSSVGALQPTLRSAVSITVEAEALVSEDQDGEEFALEWHTGADRDNLSTVNMTEVSEDQGRDGWVFVKFNDINKDFFANGTNWKVVAIHAARVRSEGLTDGDDDVVFIEANDNENRLIAIEWWYEPEEADGYSKPNLANQKNLTPLTPLKE